MEAEVALGDTMHRPAFSGRDGSLRRFDLVTANPMWNQKFPATTYENDTYGRATRWRELTERAFLFSREAKERFESGTLDDKREILVALGSNLVLKDKILRIQLQKPFDLIKEGLRELQLEKSPFEPQNLRVTANENSGREAVILKWCTTWEDVRTWLLETTEYFELPEEILARCSHSLPSFEHLGKEGRTTSRGDTSVDSTAVPAS